MGRTSVMMGSVTRVETATLLRGLKLIGTLVLIAGTVAVLAHAIVAAPRLFTRPSRSNQELRRVPDEPSQPSESIRKRAIRQRPVSA